MKNLKEFLKDSNLDPPEFSVPEKLHFVERKEELPKNFDADAVVVVDSMYYSTTVTELLHHGVEKVHLVEEKPETLEMREENPGLLAGGFRNRDYEPMHEWDFFNSPTYAEKVAEPGREAAMTSSNGAVAALKAREADATAEIFLAGPTNFHSVSTQLKQEEEIVFISSGRQGEIASEDHAGVYSVLLHLLRGGLGEDARRKVLDAVEKGKIETYSNYLNVHERRARDIEKVKRLGSRKVVPKLVDGAFEDVLED